MIRALQQKIIIMTSAAALLGCSGGLDFDLRSGPFGTANSVKDVTAKRPDPNPQGVISYPNYQVVVAKEGETINQIADRLGLDPQELASENGLEPGTLLIKDEVISIPQKNGTSGSVRTTTGAALGAQTSQIDVAQLADQALNDLEDNAKNSATNASAPTAANVIAPKANASKPALDFEPIRHKVKRGETAFTISRLYNITLRAIAEWNGLDANMTIREGQTLLIPLPKDEAPKKSKSKAVAKPGSGTVAPEPPKIAAPLPVDESPALNKPSTPAPAPSVTSEPAASSAGSSNRMTRPVQGDIIIGFGQQGNEGIDFKAAPNAPVLAARSGQVVAITQDQKKVNIVVIRHKDNLLTVYANLAQLTVKRGDSVSKGQQIGQVDNKNNNQLHFEVRDGFDALNPMDYL